MYDSMGLNGCQYKSMYTTTSLRLIDSTSNLHVSEIV